MPMPPPVPAPPPAPDSRRAARWSAAPGCGALPGAEFELKPKPPSAPRVVYVPPAPPPPTLCMLPGIAVNASQVGFAPGPALCAGMVWLPTSSSADSVIVSVAASTSGRVPNTSVAADTVIVVPVMTHASGCIVPQPDSVAQSVEPGLVLIDVASVTGAAGIATHTCQAPLDRQTGAAPSRAPSIDSGASAVLPWLLPQPVRTTANRIARCKGTPTPAIVTQIADQRQTDSR